MILSIIFIFTTMTILITLVLTNRTGEKPNGNILLGVTLPNSKMNNSQVMEIIYYYHRANTLFGITFFCLIFPILFICHLVSISTLYLLFWCVLIFYVSNLIQRIYFHKLYSLKKENEWYVSTRYVISIDTEVSRLKGKMPASRLWFILAFVFSLIPAISYLSKPDKNIISWIFILCSFISIVVGFFAHMIISKERTVTYSENTEINLALNRVYKYEWSKCWVAESYIGSILFSLMFFLRQYNILTPIIMTVLVIISTCLIIMPILSAYHKVRNQRNKLLISNSSEIYADYYQYGETGNYFNPNDKRLWVEKRFGYGTTVNMASTLGKFTNVFLVIIVIGVIALSLFLMPLDFGSVDFTVKNNTGFINAPIYKDNFSLDSIKKIELLEVLPKMSKRNGGDSDNFYVGNFNVHEYGNCSVYIYRKNGPYIVATLTNRIIIFNGSTPEETEEYLQLLHTD